MWFIVPGVNGLWFKEVFSAMKSDLIVSRLCTGLCTSTGKKWVGVKHWNKLKSSRIAAISTCNIFHLSTIFRGYYLHIKQQNSSLAAISWNLPLRSVFSAWSSQHNRAWQWSPSGDSARKITMSWHLQFFLCKFSEITTLSGEINH